MYSGLQTRTADVEARRLALEEARASALQLASGKRVTPASESEPVGDMEPVREIELARVVCEFDYRARRLGVRCGFRALGERTKRHVHTVQACVLRPAAALLALGAAADACSGAASGGGEAAAASAGRTSRSALEVMPEALRSRWGV